MINKSILIGRLTRDPEIKYSSNSTPVAAFTLAVDRSFKNANGEKEVDFIPIVAWRKTAELCGQYLFKGSQAAIVGRIQTRSYDASDGTKRYITEVVADEVQFLNTKTDAAKPANDCGLPDMDEFSGGSVPF